MWAASSRRPRRLKAWSCETVEFGCAPCLSGGPWRRQALRKPTPPPACGRRGREAPDEGNPQDAKVGVLCSSQPLAQAGEGALRGLNVLRKLRNQKCCATRSQPG